MEKTWGLWLLPIDHCLFQKTRKQFSQPIDSHHGFFTVVTFMGKSPPETMEVSPVELDETNISQIGNRFKLPSVDITPKTCEGLYDPYIITPKLPQYHPHIHIYIW